MHKAVVYAVPGSARIACLVVCDGAGSRDAYLPPIRTPAAACDATLALRTAMADAGSALFEIALDGDSRWAAAAHRAGLTLLTLGSS